MKRFRCDVALAVAVCAVVVVSAGHARAADPDGPYEPQLYGLYCWAGSYVRHADDVQKVGIRWLRAGGWTGEHADKAALLAARNGVYLQPTLSLREISHDRTLPVDEAVTKFREFCRSAVQRCGPGGSLWKEHPDVKPLPIRYWQIWNEPNIEFLNPGDSGLLRTELYARLLKAASEEIRKLDPGAHIIAFNTAGGCSYIGRGVPPDDMWQKTKYIGWRKFIKDVTKEVGPKAFDGIGTHPYTQPKGPEGRVEAGIRMLRELAAEQKFQDKPIWFTEVGYPVEYPRDLNVRDERQQACFTVRLYALSAAHGVTQVQIMYITDITYGPDGSRRSFGFFTARGKWREQARATQVMIALIPDPRKEAKILSEEPGGVWAYRFKGRNGWPIIMAWHTGEGTVEREFDAEGHGATVVQMLGKNTQVPARDGKVKVTLGEAPVYIILQTFRQKDAIDSLFNPDASPRRQKD